MKREATKNTYIFQNHVNVIIIQSVRKPILGPLHFFLFIWSLSVFFLSYICSPLLFPFMVKCSQNRYQARKQEPALHRIMNNGDGEWLFGIWEDWLITLTSYGIFRTEKWIKTAPIICDWKYVWLKYVPKRYQKPVHSHAKRKLKARKQNTASGAIRSFHFRYVAVCFNDIPPDILPTIKLKINKNQSKQLWAKSRSAFGNLYTKW